MPIKFLVCLQILSFFSETSFAQSQADIKVEVVPAPVCEVDFKQKVLDWDGFGVNYVETAQTKNYNLWKQDYGGFSILSESDRQKIIDLIFGADGLKPGITKLFLDVFHQPAEDSFTDHLSTTNWLLYFNREGLKKTRERGADLTMLTTLYGPPAWATRQKFILGRDLDPTKKDELAKYMVSWVSYLRENENLPVKYLSLHNEGDAYYRWPKDGSNPGESHRDYNMWWKPQQVTEFLKMTRKHLDKNGLRQVGLTPGETQNWYRFDMWGYARSILNDKQALKNLSLITSHSFANYDNLASIYFGDYRSTGTDILQKEKPRLHAWTTSMSWGKTGGVDFIDAIYRNIYLVKSNAIIPWALVQRSSQWLKGDPNPVTAIKVTEDSTFSIQPGYYYYKQVSRAGQPGMFVAAVSSLDPAVELIAFAKNKTKNSNAFVLINISDVKKETEITVKGADNSIFKVWRTGPEENYEPVGEYKLVNQMLKYTAPPLSVTTFYEQD